MFLGDSEEKNASPPKTGVTTETVPVDFFFLVTDEVYLFFFVKSAGMENPDELQYPDVDIRSNIYLKSGFSS